MSETKYFICPCQHCHELIQFPAESVGLTTPCPHCAQETELILPPPPEVDDGSRRTKAWAVAGAIILLLGLVGAMVSMFMLKKYAAESRQKNSARAAVAATNPPASSARSASFSTNDFVITLPRMEKAGGSSLTYAIGTVRNDTDRTRYGVKIELALLNADGETIGKATDYHQVLEARSEWKFRALVLERKATGVRLEQIQEDK
jgi:hypothetical protein